MICFLLDIEPLSNDGVWDRIRALLRNSSVSLNSSVVLTLFTLLLLTLQQTSKMTTLFKRLSNEDTTFLVLCYTTARGRITFVKVAMETKKKRLYSQLQWKMDCQTLQTTIVLTWLSSLTTSSIIRKAFQKIPS